MKTIKIIPILFITILPQLQAQNIDISLVDVGWYFSCDEECKIHGIYKMTNNSNKKITITRIYIHQNNWCQITPYINAHVQANDSLVLQPLEQKEFSYSCMNILSRYHSMSLFIKGTRSKVKNNSCPGIDLFITYKIDNNEQKSYYNRLYFWLDNLMDFPEELTDSLIPFVDEQRCDKYKSYVEWEKKMRRGDQVMNIREWGGTLFEQRICPCIENKE